MQSVRALLGCLPSSQRVQDPSVPAWNAGQASHVWCADVPLLPSTHAAHSPFMQASPYSVSLQATQRAPYCTLREGSALLLVVPGPHRTRGWPLGQR